MKNINKLLKNMRNNYVLAPMHGVNCLAFRQLCLEYGAGLVSTPMIHANWLAKEKKLPKDIEFGNEKNISVQLVGENIKNMKIATKIVEDYADIIDINCGCPSPDIMALKCGAYLSKYPKKIGEIVNAVVGSTSKPVTAKIRSGWNENKINAIEVGKIIEDNGAVGVALHARTVKQGYSGEADWELIKKLKESIKIKVFGNGDVWSGELAHKMLKETKVDYVMIGRAAMSYPFIFKECLDVKYKPTIEDRHKCILRFIELYEKQKKQSIVELKQHLMWLFKGLDGAKEIRVKMASVKDVKLLKKMSEEFFHL
jgi:tRNA-dihydrouridine synthase B